MDDMKKALIDRWYDSLDNRDEKLNKSRSKLPKRFSILTGDNPAAKKTTDRNLEDQLKERGYRYKPAKGHYTGKSENSYIVEDADVKHIEDLGSQHGQESVIHVDGEDNRFVFTSGENKGKHHKGQGSTHYNERPEGDHTEHEGGYFNLNFDWDKLHD